MEPSGSPHSKPVLIARGLFRAVENAIRVTFTLFFAGLAIALIFAAANSKPKVPSSSALVLDINGDVVEQESARSPRELLVGASGTSKKETGLKDLIDALDAGREDKRIKAAFLLLDEMGGAGMTKLQDLGAAIDRFKKSGKKVIAYSDSYSQNAYYLASRADELYMHPQGMVLLEGLGSYRWYYKDAIDKIGLEWNVFRVGEYKSAVEPYLRNDMSPEAKQANLDWMGDIWTSYLDDVAKARKKKPEEITALIEGLPERLKEAGGDGGRLAIKERLVDKLLQRDEVRKRLIELVGEDKKLKSYNRVGFHDYLAALGGDRKERGKGDAVAVVVAKGEILDGRQPAGKIGGDSTAALIRKAREDEKVKAIVLRVDSPGGSAFASEVIRRELELARQEKKPVVVSMGTVAASGGYWISTSSDEIWANPNTITGSIGIFGMFPNFGKAMAQHLGVHVDGVGTTSMAGALRLDRPLDPRVGEAIQSAINRGYEEFLERVSAARKMKKEDVDKIARGRVWSGMDALKAGLVDKLGGLEEAIESAAQKAKLGKGFRVVYIEKDLTMKEKLFRSFATRALAIANWQGLAEESHPARPSPLFRFEEKLQEEAARLGTWNDPHGIYAHCLCDLR